MSCVCVCASVHMLRVELNSMIKPDSNLWCHVSVLAFTAYIFHVDLLCEKRAKIKKKHGKSVEYPIERSSICK